MKKKSAKSKKSVSDKKTQTTHEKKLDDDKLPKVQKWYRDYAKSRLPMIAEIPKVRNMVEGSGRHDLIFAAYFIAICAFVHGEAVACTKIINETFALKYLRESV